MPPAKRAAWAPFKTAPEAKVMAETGRRNTMASSRGHSADAPSSRARAIVWAALASVLPACDAPDPSVNYAAPSGAGVVALDEVDAGDASISIDPFTVIESIARDAYLESPAFTEVTRAPYASTAAVGSLVSEWVSTPALGAYLAVSPGVTGSGVTLPVGTTIVRAVLAADGGVDELTLMFKGPRGYNPALGDWWFAVTDTDGLPIDADGGAELGRLANCYSCHIPRSEDGYVFGVPLDDRVSATEN